MPLRRLDGQAVDTAAIMGRINEVEAEGKDQFENVRGMIHRRDPRLDDAEAKANAAVEKYDTLEELAASYAQALPASIEDRAALHRALEALTQRVDGLVSTPGPAGPQGERGPAGQQGPQGAQGLRGPSGTDGVQGQPGQQGQAGRDGATGATGPAGPTGASGTANLAIGSRPVGALILGGSTTVTVPLSRTMPDTNYRVELTHSAIPVLADGMLVETGRTRTSVTVRVTGVGVALLAGTLIVAAV